MTTEIIKSGACPKIEKGVLCFHEGDNFALSLRCVLTNMGAEVDPGEILKLIILFRDSRGIAVYTFEEECGEDGCAQFAFTPTVSEKFRKGRYEYDVAVVTATIRETVAASLPCIVI